VQLCPMAEPGDLDKYHWFADESICPSKQFGTLPWIRKQRTIQKLGITSDAGYFTRRMLEAVARVTKGLKGADPDLCNSERKWMKERKRPQTVLRPSLQPQPC